MKKNHVSQSDIFNPRVLVAFALCSFGVFLGMFSLAATPLSERESSPWWGEGPSPPEASRKAVETTRANPSVAPDLANFLSTSDNDANRLPPGVPFPPGAQFSVNEHARPSSNRPTVGLPGFAGMSLPPYGMETLPGRNPGTPGGTNSLANPAFANEQPAASESMPLASAATGAWSIVNSPNTPQTPTRNLLAAVTCVSASECWAVGSYYSGSIDQTLIERWDGSSWAIVSSPNTLATEYNYLQGVTCVSGSDCWAVGYYIKTNGGYQTLIQHWDGVSWTIVTSPNTSDAQNNVLHGVTCASASNCWAVGYYDNGTTNQTLIERWDGTSWTIITSPNTSGTQLNVLLGVACASASDCWAVGYYFNSNVIGVAYQTLIERWDGTSWAIASSPNTLPTRNNILLGVTCVSANDCWAVGVYSTGNTVQRGAWQTLIERWDGTSWAIISSPNTSTEQDNYLYGVTCGPASNCWAVGHYINGSTQQTLIARWDGTSWAIVTSPNTSSGQDNFLASVMCVSATAECWAVGHYINDSTHQTLIERWDGTSWTIVTSPNILAQPNNHLYDVACVSASDCWAVGYYNSMGGFAQTLIEHWDGTAWTIVTSRNTSATQNNFLLGVACVSASDCWAVGFYINGSVLQTLAERWDGASWTVVTSPNSSATQLNVLKDVTCVSPSNCWAIGYYRTGTITQTLIEHWEGNAWTIVPSPNTSPAQNNALAAVTCVSAANCWTVGDHINTGGFAQTLMEHWDGNSWAIATSANTSAEQDNFLLGVTCVSASNCWAVGYYHNGPTLQTLIERWDGTSWAIATSPNTSSAQDNVLAGVACASGAADCWAVGSYIDGSIQRTLIDRWDGASWTIATSPNISSAQNSLLLGVTSVSVADCWAVGFYRTGSLYQTLTEHYAAALPLVPTSVVSRKTHGLAGDFDIDLPLLGTPGIECRMGSAVGDHQIVVTFPGPVTFASAAVTSGIGAVASSGGNGTSTLTVNLTGVTNAQAITVTLTGVSNGTDTSDVLVPLSLLLGDSTASGEVNSSDIGATKANSGQATTATNFRTDVTVNGVINSSDISLVKSKSGTALP